LTDQKNLPPSIVEVFDSVRIRNNSLSMTVPKSKGKSASAAPTNKEDDPYANSEVVKAFGEYKKELDAKHDKHERIYKISRDINIESKRIIYSLHGLLRSGKVEEEKRNINKALDKIVDTHIRRIGLELEGEDQYKYLQAYYSSIQEYIEAKTYNEYLNSGSLYNWGQIKGDCIVQLDVFQPSSTPNLPATVVDTKLVPINIPVSAYISGVQDLTGELMRYCINSLCAGRQANAFKARDFVRTLYTASMNMDSRMAAEHSWYGREFFKKQSVLRESLSKMEVACYMMHVRGSEFHNQNIACKLGDHLFTNSDVGRSEEDLI